MQKPRLTQKTAEALRGMLADIRATYADMESDPSWDAETWRSRKRAVEYLEDLLRWQRGQQKENVK